MSCGTLIIRPEKLGDLVVATPVFRAFKESYPGEPVHLLTDEVFAAVVEKDPHLDQIIPIRWRGRKRGQHLGWRQIAARLAGQKYRRAAILYDDCAPWNLLCRWLGIHEVAQLGGTIAAIVFNHRMVLRKGYVAGKHYSELYLEVAAALGATTTETIPQLHVHATEIAALRSRFHLVESRRRILLHPFGITTYANFGLQAYARLAAQLAETFDADIYVIGSHAEAGTWPEFADERIKRDWLGSLTLREVLAAASIVDLAIGGPSGIGHCAAALGTPTIGLYCPSGNHVAVWGPRGHRATTLAVPGAFCRRMGAVNSPCGAPGLCDISFGISTEEVLAVAAQSLAANKAPRSP